MFLSAIKAMASNTVAAGSIDHTVEPFFARIPLIVPAIFMLYLRPGGGRIQKQSWGLVNVAGPRASTELGVGEFVRPRLDEILGVPD